MASTEKKEKSFELVKGKETYYCEFLQDFQGLPKGLQHAVSASIIEELVDEKIVKVIE